MTWQASRGITMLVRLLAATVTCLLLVALPATEPRAQRPLETTAPSPDAVLASLLDRYARGEVSVELRPGTSTLELQRQLRRVGSSWIGPRNGADSGRRRLVIATLALEIIDDSLETAWRPGFSGDLLEWSCELLREGPATEDERTWHLAAVAQLERASAFGLISGPVSQATRDSRLVTHVVHAERRFPKDGRWALARAMDAEHAVWPPLLEEDVLRPMPDHENRIRNRLEAAFKLPDVSGEAHLRWGYFHLRRGRVERALAEFEAAGQPEDRALRYWQHFFRGQTLARMNRTSEATESYRLALSAFPHAQAAALSLAVVLARDGNISEAGELVNDMLKSAPVDDPWNVYGYPAYRHWSDLLRQLRGSIAR